LALLQVRTQAATATPGPSAKWRQIKLKTP
jgi:hypothetical protein